MKIFFPFLILTLLWNYSNCAKILGVFPFPGYSQYILGEKLMTELAKRGHQVTIVTEFEPKEKIENFEIIKLQKSEPFDNSFDLLTWTSFNDYACVRIYYDLMMEPAESILKQDVMQDFLHSNRTFDLVIVDILANEAHMAFAKHFNATLALFCSQSLHDWNSHLVGNVKLPSISPNAFSVNQYTNQMSFFRRLHNFGLTIYSNLYREFKHLPQCQRIIDTYFPTKMDLKEILTSAELMLVFSHPVTTEPSLLTSAVVEIGGFHITSHKLNTELKNFLDASKNGAVLISLGSNVDCRKLSQQKFDLFLNVIRRMPYDFLWKCERQIPDKPKNLYISKWLPQSDILAHPNVVAFITHNGLLSTTEAIYHGIPMISLPLFADQPLNAARAVKNGIAEQLNFLTMSENELYQAINKVVTNSSYKTRIEKLSNMLRDQPSKPLDRAVHSIEYVLKYKPGEYMRSSALDLWWFQLYSIDVILFIFFSVFSFFAFLSFTVRKVFFGKSHSSKSKIH